MSDLLQTAIVTLVALGAAGVIVRRMWLAYRPSKDQPACPSCPSNASPRNGR